MPFRGTSRVSCAEVVEQVSDRAKGKVVPLTPSKSSKDGSTGEATYDRIPLPIAPPGLLQADRMLGYFPSSLKEYYRRALMEYKEVHGIGNQKLRDLIMEPEDTVLRSERQAENLGKSSPIERDTRLTLDDLKKWFGNKSSHHIGDAKFTFINRFAQQVLIEGGFDGFQIRYNKERTNFHRQALRDIFASTYLSQSVAQVLDGTEPHILISSLPGRRDVLLPTCVILCGGFYGGIAPVNLLFSEAPAMSRQSQFEYRDEFYIAIAKSRIPIVLRGYVVVTASEYEAGRPDAHRKNAVNAKFILTNEDIHKIGEDILPYSRIIADGRIEVARDDDDTVLDYSMTVDTTEFPDEASTKSEIKKTRAFDGASYNGSKRILLARLVKDNEHLDAIFRKYGGGYR